MPYHALHFMPMNIFKSKTLVSLKLAYVGLDVREFVADSVSLPCLKTMNLEEVYYWSDGSLVMGKLISGCPALEDLTVERTRVDHHYHLPLLTVRSQTLRIFRLICNHRKGGKDFSVEIDAPRLKYMSFSDNQSDTILVKNLSSLVKIDLDTDFKVKFRSIPSDFIHDFLNGISSVRHMIISQRTLEVLYRYFRLGRMIPKFYNLSHLKVVFSSSSLEMLPIFLESCPNLKNLMILDYSVSKEPEQIDITYVPRCLQSTLECVEISRLIMWEKTGMKLVRYFLENSAVLMKLNLSFSSIEDLDIYEELLASTKRSRRCQIKLFY